MSKEILLSSSAPIPKIGGAKFRTTVAGGEIIRKFLEFAIDDLADEVKTLTQENVSHSVKQEIRDSSALITAYLRMQLGKVSESIAKPRKVS